MENTISKFPLKAHWKKRSTLNALSVRSGFAYRISLKIGERQRFFRITPAGSLTNLMQFDGHTQSQEQGAGWQSGLLARVSAISYFASPQEICCPGNLRYNRYHRRPVALLKDDPQPA